MNGVYGGVFVVAGAGAGCGIGVCWQASTLLRMEGCAGLAHSGVRCQADVYLGVRQLLVVFACFVNAQSLLLSPLMFCSLFRALAVCCW